MHEGELSMTRERIHLINAVKICNVVHKSYKLVWDDEERNEKGSSFTLETYFFISRNFDSTS